MKDSFLKSYLKMLGMVYLFLLCLISVIVPMFMAEKYSDLWYWFYMIEVLVVTFWLTIFNKHFGD